MRRILAILAVVVALLFGAGSAWADWDDGWAAYNRGNFATAFRVFKALAKQGDERAEFVVAGLYLRGQGVPRNRTEADKWFLKAAEHGDALAAGVVGHMYRDGDGVPKNYIKAYMWWFLADDAGLATADLLDSLKKEMTPAQIGEAQKLAATMWQKLSVRNYPHE